MLTASMPRVVCALGLWLVIPSSALAQPAAPSIGPLVVDAHLTFPNFPSNAQLATSRNVNEADLPGLGRGGDIGAHVYVFRWRAITFGVGANLMVARALTQAVPAATGTPTTPTTTTTVTPGKVVIPPAGQAVTERMTMVSPQLSFNFGNGYGWSYISGGLGRTTWYLVPGPEVTAKPGEADDQPIKTINYGGGGRWFAKKHLAFSFDVRFYAINPGPPNGPFVGSPRTTLLVIGGGVSIKP